MTWTEHPRLRKQKEDRIKLLAQFQYEHNFSRDEMADFFKQMASDKIQEQNSTENDNQTFVPNYNHWEMVAQKLKHFMQTRKK